MLELSQYVGSMQRGLRVAGLSFCRVVPGLMKPNLPGTRFDLALVHKKIALEPAARETEAIIALKPLQLAKHAFQ